MRKVIPVEGHPNLVRDAHTGAVLNINTKSLHDARSAKERRREERKEIEQMKADLSEIKALLQMLVKTNG